LLCENQKFKKTKKQKKQLHVSQSRRFSKNTRKVIASNMVRFDTDDLETGSLKSSFPVVKVIYYDVNYASKSSMGHDLLVDFMDYIKSSSTSFISREIQTDDMNLDLGPVGFDSLAGLFDHDMKEIEHKMNQVFIISDRREFLDLFSKVNNNCTKMFIVSAYDEPITKFKSIMVSDARLVNFAVSLFGCADVQSVVSNAQSIMVTKTAGGAIETVEFEFYENLFHEHGTLFVTNKVDLAVEYMMIFLDFMDCNLRSEHGPLPENKTYGNFTVTNRSSLCQSEMENFDNVIIRISEGENKITITNHMITDYIQHYENDGFESYDWFTKVWREKFEKLFEILETGKISITLPNGPLTNCKLVNAGSYIDPGHKPLFPIVKGQTGDRRSVFVPNPTI
jgi:hypothetical protein